jgi:hypothetical protein
MPSLVLVLVPSLVLVLVPSLVLVRRRVRFACWWLVSMHVSGRLFSWIWTRMF